jgi:hypothetical protein
MDHGFRVGKPILFETMTFGLDIEICERYTTWEEAEQGHAEIVSRLFRWCK